MLFVCFAEQFQLLIIYIWSLYATVPLLLLLPLCIRGALLLCRYAHIEIVLRDCTVAAVAAAERIVFEKLNKNQFEMKGIKALRKIDKNYSCAIVPRNIKILPLNFWPRSVPCRFMFVAKAGKSCLSRAF